MSNQHHKRHHRSDLVRLAARCMLDRGLEPEFPPEVEQEVARLEPVSGVPKGAIRDLTALPWCSIDNDDSRDLDQLTACEPLDNGSLRLWVAIADVDALVRKDCAIDRHAQINTTSVYTSARIFPMLPERLSTDLSSLNENEVRQAMVTEMVFDEAAQPVSNTVFQARVRNKSKLAYDAVSAWIEGTGPLPEAAAAVQGMDQQLRLQDGLAQKLKSRRHAEGSLEFESFEPRAEFAGENVVAIRQQVQNRARQLIEEVMIATNGCTARFLAAHGGSSLRRVVRSPERWLRIAGVAQEYGETLPAEPDGKALEAFLARRHREDPLRFPDLSLVIVKLMGRGEYVVERQGEDAIGHFGLAVRDYTHSTAPNRRYPDLITLRMLKAVLNDQPAPYGDAELQALARQCTQQEDAAQKVERQMRKSEAALVLESRVGEEFEALVTGSSDKGVWVRLLTPHIEGRLMDAEGSEMVGDRMRVRLQSTDVERGFIDFTHGHPRNNRRERSYCRPDQDQS